MRVEVRLLQLLALWLLGLATTRLVLHSRQVRPDRIEEKEEEMDALDSDDDDDDDEEEGEQKDESCRMGRSDSVGHVARLLL